MNWLKAITCVVLSKEVYYNQVSFSYFPESTPLWIDEPSTDTQAALLINESSLYIVFRGTQPDDSSDWKTDLDFALKDEDFQMVYPYPTDNDSGSKMHRGFVNAYLSVRDQIHSYLTSNHFDNVTVTGHSLGGALATLCAVDVQYNFAPANLDIYTFGSPKVGNSGFTDSFNERVPQSYRFVNGMDIVTTLPTILQGYSHVDTEYKVGSGFSLNDHDKSSYVEAVKEAASQSASNP